MLRRKRPAPAAKPPKLRVEALEDRTVPYGSVLTTGSADLAVSFAGGNWGLTVQNETAGNTTLPANDTLLGVVADKAVAIRPAGGQWNFLGVESGKSFYRLPQTPDANLLSLGVDTTGVPAGAFQAYTPNDPRAAGSAPWVKLGLVDLRGPGEFSVYQTDAGGNPKTWISTADNGLVRFSEYGDNLTVKEDSIYLQPGQDQNLTWAFSKPGHYRATFVASAMVAGQMSASAPVTYDFFAPASLPDVSRWLIDEHVDLGMDYRTNPSGALGWEITAEDGDAAPQSNGQVPQYPGDEVGLFVGPRSLTARPAGAEYDFLGTPAGANLWVLDQSGPTPNALYQGFATEETEETAENAFLTYFNTDTLADSEGQWIRVGLRDVIGPAGGHFSLWTEGDGVATVHMASADGIDSADRTWLLLGDHRHYNWGFTQPGIYQIGFEASTILDSNNNGSIDYDDANGNDRIDAGETIYDAVSSSGIRYFYFSVDTPNDAPVNAAPAAVNATANRPLAFTGANGVSVSDPNPHPNAMEVRLAVTNGTVALGSLAGLTVAGGANGTATVTVRGQLAALNAALATLTYTPTAGFAGTDTLTILTNDRGFFYPDNSIPSSPDADDLPDNFRTDADTVSIAVRPGVEGVVVNAGAAQRSRVTTLAVTFTGEVTLAAGAFSLTGVDLNGNAISVGTVSFTTQNVGGNTIATLSFSGAGTNFGSLADGRWNLAVDATKVTAGGQEMASPFTQTGIRRLFGDVDGNGTVNGLDLTAFRAAFGGTYRADLDSNGDGVVNGLDLTAFRTRFGVTLP